MKLAEPIPRLSNPARPPNEPRPKGVALMSAEKRCAVSLQMLPHIYIINKQTAVITMHVKIKTPGSGLYKPVFNLEMHLPYEWCYKIFVCEPQQGNNLKHKPIINVTYHQTLKAN